MKRNYLAIEIGGTKLQAAIVSSDGQIRDSVRGRVDRAQGAGGIRQWLEQAAPPLLEKAENGPVYGIGIGFGGPVDGGQGRVLCSHQIAGWENYPLVAWAEKAWGLPALLENDAQAAGWAEYCLGAGRGVRNFAYMNIGSGIGGAFAIDGELYNGQGLGAAEIGHMVVSDPWGQGPGAAIRLEDRCSGWAIEKRLRQLDPAVLAQSQLHELCHGDASQLTCAMLGQAAAAQDPLACDELRRIVHTLGQAMANVITLFHPEVFALGGGVSLMGEVLFGPLRARVGELVFGPYRDRYVLEPCALEEEVVIRGAGLLAAKAFPLSPPMDTK